MNPLFSVIIPLFNKETIIERTIQSVLNQSFKDFELIIVNDGSTDCSMDVVRTIHDNRIVLVEQENGGPGKARNTGAEYSKGKWIVFLDADDELLPDALQTYASLADTHPEVDIFDCGQKLKNGDDISYMQHSLEGYSTNPMRDWFFNKISPGSNHSIFKKTIIVKYPYNPNIRRFEDAELLVRILQTAKVYSSTVTTSLVHCDFSSASKKRKDISEDFVGHLSMKEKEFWTKMCVYRIYLENRELYPEEMRRLYPTWYYRYDLLLLYKLLNYIAK
jgi:glycosyltransferase involved in cell wall biosynthesis